METNWTKKEFKAYLLLFAAHANFIESKPELDFIKEQVGAKNLAHIRHEFEKDNDYQHIQKIESTVSRLGYENEDIEGLFDKIKTLFLADGKMDVLEDNFFKGLRHILIK